MSPKRTYWQTRRSKMIKTLILMLTVRIVVSTVDINLPEMKYIADHLKRDECRKLVASLHYKTYNPPDNLELDEFIDKDLPCLGLLLNWNSGKGEGKDETHELLFLRLKQIGKHDLAEWLAKTVFQQLGIDLHKRVKEPFQEFLDNTDNGKDDDKDTDSADDFAPDKTGQATHRELSLSDEKATFLKEQSYWVPFDTVCWMIILVLALATIVIVGRAVYKSYTEGKQNSPPQNKRPQKRSYREYERMENQPMNAHSDTESEDRFDVRKDDQQGRVRK